MDRISAYFDDNDPLAGPHLNLKLHGKDARVTVANDFRQIERITGHLPDMLRDFVDIAAATYMADRFVEADQRMYRELELHIKVRDKGVWKKISEDLNEAVSFLMQVPVKFKFLTGENPPINKKGDNDLNLNNVICFSGGLDSYLGTMSLKEYSGSILMSHFNNNLLSSFQKTAAKGIPKNRRLPHLQVYVGSSRADIGRRKLGSQRYAMQPSRSFLFLALAGTLAIATGARRIYMFENGPMALGIPYTPARINTRTVHPIFLDLMQRIIQGIPGGQTITIENPFQKLTKAEIVSNSARFLTNRIQHTFSCSGSWRVNINRNDKDAKPLWHCGYCIPCINRRLSIMHEEQQAKDTSDNVDILEDYPFDSLDPSIATEALMNVQDLIVFAEQFAHRTSSELLERFPGLYFESNRISPDEVLGMQKRWAIQILDTLKDNSGHKLKADLMRLY